MSEQQLTPEQIDAIAAVLRQIPLFAQLTGPDFQALVGITHSESYHPGAEIYHQSEADNTLYVIVSGAVSLHHIDPQGASGVVGEMGPGDSLGEASLLLGEPHDVTLTAKTYVEALTIARDDLSTLAQRVPGLFARLTPTEESARKLNAPHFGWQADDESVVIFAREHPWGLVRESIIPLVVLTALVILGVLLERTIPALILPYVILSLLALLFVFGYVLIDWRNDYFVVTNRRVVHVDTIPIIRHNREEAPLSAISEIQTARTSIWAALLDFGDLRVETFGGAVAMRGIAHPEDVKNLIQRQIDLVKARARASERRAIQRELEQRIRPEPEQFQPAVAPVTVSPITPAPRPWAIFANMFRYFFPKLREVQGDSIVWRKHWIVLWRKAAGPAALVVVSLFGAVAWWQRLPLLGGLPVGFWWLCMIAFVVGVLWYLWVFEDWRNDQYIVTPTRVIDIERVPFLLSETQREASLSKIQTTDLNIPTPLARFLGYGDVIIRVPGADIQFVSVQHPGAVQTEITQRMTDFARRQSLDEARKRQTELSDWFAVYDQLREDRRWEMPIAEGEKTSDGGS